MNEIKINIEITVDDKVTKEKFGKLSKDVTIGEYRELLLSPILEKTPFQVNKVGMILT